MRASSFEDSDFKETSDLGFQILVFVLWTTFTTMFGKRVADVEVCSGSWQLQFRVNPKSEDTGVAGDFGR